MTEIDFRGFPRLLVRTNAWQDLDSFLSHIPTVDPELAPFLESRGVSLLGVDLPSIDTIDSKELKAHHALHQHHIYYCPRFRVAPCGACALLPCHAAAGFG